MKQSFLSKFTRFGRDYLSYLWRSPGSAPAGWPTDDVAEIDASAAELKKITSDLMKKIALCMPSTNRPSLIPVDFSVANNDTCSNGSLAHGSSERCNGKGGKVEELTQYHLQIIRTQPTSHPPLWFQSWKTKKEQLTSRRPHTTRHHLQMRIVKIHRKTEKEVNPDFLGEARLL